MSNNRNLAKNTILLYFRMFFALCVNLYLSRVVLSVLGVVDYGIYNVVAGVVSMFSVLIGSLGGATSRYLTIEIGRNNIEGFRRIFSSLLLIFLFLGMIIVILAETVGLWFLETKLVIPIERIEAVRWLYQFTILGAFAAMLQVPYIATIIAHERMKAYAYIGVGEVLMKLAFVFLLSILSFDKLILWGFLLMILPFFVLCCFVKYCISTYPYTKFKLQKDKDTYRELLTYSGWDLIGCLSFVAQGQGINMLLNIFFGPIVNAARGIAYQIESAIRQFRENFLTAVRPQVFKLYAVGNVDAMMALVSFSTKISFILMYLLILPISLKLSFILTLWLGHYPDYTVAFSLLVLVNNLLETLGRGAREMVYHAMNKLKYTKSIFSVCYCLSLPIGYWFCRMDYPPYCVFYSVVIINLVVNVIGLFLLNYFTGYPVSKSFFDVDFRCFILVLFTAGPLYYISLKLDDSFSSLFVVVVLSVIIILSFSFIICFNKIDRCKIIYFIKNKLSLS